MLLAYLLIFVSVCGIIYIALVKNKDPGIHSGTFTVQNNTSETSGYSKNGVWIQTSSEYDSSLINYALVRYVIQIPKLFGDRYFKAVYVNHHKGLVCIMFKDAETNEQLVDEEYFLPGSSHKFIAYLRAMVQE